MKLAIVITAVVVGGFVMGKLMMSFIEYAVEHLGSEDDPNQ